MKNSSSKKSGLNKFLIGVLAIVAIIAIVVIVRAGGAKNQAASLAQLSTTTLNTSAQSLAGSTGTPTPNLACPVGYIAVGLNCVRSTIPNLPSNPVISKPTPPILVGTAVCPVNTPTITVTSPNGGEVYTAGQTITVKWTSCNLPSSTMLHLFNGYYQNGTTSGSGQLGTFPNTGSATVTLNGPIPQYGNFYKVTVTNGTTIANGTIDDVSDNTFAINTLTTLTKLNVSKDGSDSSDHIVIGSNSSNTQGVPLATIDLNAQGNSTVNVQRIPVTVGVVKVAGATTAKVSDMINTLRLYNSAGTQLDSEPILANGSCSGTSLAGVSGALCTTVMFQNLGNVNGVLVPQNGTSVLTIKGDVSTLNQTTFVAGTYAVAEVAPANTLAIQAYDSNNNLLQQNSNYLTGSTIGSKVYFYANTINVTSNGTVTNTYSNPGGGQVHGVFSMTIPFSVTAIGATAYVPDTAKAITTGTANAPTASAAAAIQYAVDNGSSLLSGSSAVIAYTGSDSFTPDQYGNYAIRVGQTKNFNLIINYTPTVGGSYRAQLVNVNWNNTDSATTYNTYTAGLNASAFKTPYVAGQ